MNDLGQTRPGSLKKGIVTNRKLDPLNPHYPLSQLYTSGFTVGEELKKIALKSQTKIDRNARNFNIITNIGENVCQTSEKAAQTTSNIIFNNDGRIFSDFKNNPKKTHEQVVGDPPALIKNFESLGVSGLERNPLLGNVDEKSKNILMPQQNSRFNDFLKTTNVVAKLRERENWSEFAKSKKFGKTEKYQPLFERKTNEEMIDTVIVK